MFDLGNFLLESGVSLGLFYLLYWLLLRRQTFFSLNRAVLLFTTLLSLALPFISISLPEATPERSLLYVMDQFTLESGIWLNGQVTAPVSKSLSLTDILVFLYLAGLLFFSLRFLAELFHIVYLFRKCREISSDGFRVILVSKKLAPFSFFKWIFIAEEDWAASRQEDILSHEKEHIRKGHSMDMLLLGFLTIVQWFNPFAWLYKWTLRELHEYEADHEIIRKGTNTLHYQHIILQQVFGVQFFRYVNHLNQSHIKKRFAMMTKNRSGRIAVLRTLSIIPLTAVLFALFAFNRDNLQWPAHSAPEGDIPFVAPFETGERIDPAPYIPGLQKEQTILPVQETFNSAPPEGKQDTVVFKVVEVMPRFRGVDEKGFQNYLMKELRYPENMKAEGRSATVFVSFVIDPAGKLTRARVAGSRDNEGRTISAPEFEQEALRVVKTSPDWDPGKQRGKNVAVEITLPIRFMLDGGEKKESAQVNEETEEPIFFVVEEMPTFSYKDSNNIGAFRTYIADQLVYPEEAKRKGVTGRIFVRFIVEPDGSVSGVDIVRGLETDKDELKSAVEALNREALRVMRESPPWIPGKQRGHNVRVAFTFPIIFMLTGKDEADRYMESLDQKK